MFRGVWGAVRDAHAAYRAWREGRCWDCWRPLPDPPVTGIDGLRFCSTRCAEETAYALTEGP